MRFKKKYNMTLALFIFLVLTLLIPYVVFSFEGTDTPTSDTGSIQVIAHRGASGYAPENTLASFAKGIEMGADILELDVHLTKDDSLIVMHDHNVKRTTNGTGDILDMSFEELRKLDAGSWFNEQFKNEKVPTLDEVLKLVAGRKKVLIELKWPAKGIYQQLVEKVIAVIRQNHAESWTIIQSFETRYLDQLDKLDSTLVQQQLIFGKSSIFPIYFDRRMRFGKFRAHQRAASINPFFLYATRKFLRQTHASGKKVYAFTPSKEKDMQKLVKRGVDGIITNYPDRALKVLNR